MKKLILVAFMVLALSAGAVGSALAITNGTDDGNGHPYVGSVIFDVDGVPSWRCSGALLSPTVFLTAGHCTDGATGARVWFDNPITDSLYPKGGGASIEAVEIHTAPGFCIGCAKGLPGFDTHDVGVVILGTPKTLTEYALLPALGRVDTLPMKTEITAVGYGVRFKLKISGPPGDRWTGSRIRSVATSQLIQANDVISAEYMKVTANPAQEKGGTCFGDSGGPNFLAGTGTILAVTSFGPNANCAGVGYQNRIDLQYAQVFIRSFLP